MYAHLICDHIFLSEHKLSVTMQEYQKWDENEAKSLAASFREVRGGLLPALHALQDAFGYIHSSGLDLLADTFNLSRAEVFGVVSFYDDFRSEPVGQPVIKVCMAEACQAMGARDLRRDAEKITGSNALIEDVFCLGNCACGPSIRVGEHVFGRVNGNRLREIVVAMEGGGDE
jgi:formate dehydrogenase subunit gamma